MTSVTSPLVSARWLCHDRQAYCSPMLIRPSILVCRSLTSEFKAHSESDRRFFSNSLLINLRQFAVGSECVDPGETQNLVLERREGSTMKSGNDLWNGLTGSSGSSSGVISDDHYDGANESPDL
jgi:hypothetical protein